MTVHSVEAVLLVAGRRADVFALGFLGTVGCSVRGDLPCSQDDGGLKWGLGHLACVALASNGMVCSFFVC